MPWVQGLVSFLCTAAQAYADPKHTSTGFLRLFAVLMCELLAQKPQVCLPRTAKTHLASSYCLNLAASC